MAGGSRKLGPRVSGRQMKLMLKCLQQHPFMTKIATLCAAPVEAMPADNAPADGMSTFTSSVASEQESATIHKRMWEKLSSDLNAAVYQARIRDKDIKAGNSSKPLNSQERAILTLAGVQKRSISRWTHMPDGRPVTLEEDGGDGSGGQDTGQASGSAMESESDVGDGEGSMEDSVHIIDNQSDDETAGTDPDGGEQHDRGSDNGSMSRSSNLNSHHNGNWVSCGRQDCSAALLQLVEIQKSAVQATERLTEAVKIIANAVERIEKHLRPASNVPCPTPPSH